MGRVEGKIALVTGAAGGIGRATAELLASEGAKVFAADLAETMTYDHPSIHYFRLDVSNEADWKRVVAEIIEESSGVDILVNNAGAGNFEPIDQESIEGWNRIVGINQTGAFLGIREVVPSMRARGGGAIVNVSSVFCVTAIPGLAAYHASKGANRAIARNAAITYAPDKIRVNSLHPGITRTPMVASVPDEVNDATIARTPLGRMAEPIELAYGILFLVSDEASFVTGIELPVDGGYLAF